MPWSSDFDLVKSPSARIVPELEIHPATGPQAELARPWSIMSGEPDFDVVQFSDGGTKHAPAVVSHLRELFAADPAPGLLIFAHRGHQIECMMPLLPSLLFAIGYRGPAQAIRRVEGETEAETERKIRRLALGQLPIGGQAVLVEDRQDRIGARGSLRAGEVVISHLALRPIPEITV